MRIPRACIPGAEEFYSPYAVPHAGPAGAVPAERDLKERMHGNLRQD